MSVQSEITRLQNAKTALKTAIEGKGVTVPNNTKLDGYADLVDNISAGGSDGDVWYAVDGIRGIKYILYNDDSYAIYDGSYSASNTGNHVTFYSNYYTHKWSIYFEYKGEKYYTTDINVGNSNHLPLTKTGTPVENPTISGGFDRFRLYLDNGVWYTDFSD